MGVKKRTSKKLKKKWWSKKVIVKKKCGVVLKKFTKIRKKNGGQKSVGHIPTSYHWALVWAKSKLPEMAWNGTDFFLIVFENFNRVVFPYDFCKKWNLLEYRWTHHGQSLHDFWEIFNEILLM